MASIHKVKTSKNWFGLVSLPGGKRIFRSTGKEDKVEALKAAMEWERVAKGAMPESEEQARRVLTDIMKQAIGTNRGRISCKDFEKRWIASLKGTVAKSTMDFYSGVMNSWIRWLGDRADRPIDSVSREDIVAWRTAEASRVSAKTTNQRLKVVRSMFRAAILESFAITNPAEGLKAVKPAAKEQRARRPFSREEIATVLAACDDTWRIMTLTGLQTGQRLGDIARMRWSELDFKKACWTLKTGKTGTHLRIPLSSELAGLLDKLKKKSKPAKDSAPVFPDFVAELERSQGYVGSLSKRFIEILRQAKLRADSPSESGDRSHKKATVPKASNRRQQQELSFHSLRHTARTWLEEAGQPKAVIDALIGHEGDTGKIYTSVGENALRNAAAALAAAGGPK
jgi:integrase